MIVKRSFIFTAISSTKDKLPLMVQKEKCKKSQLRWDEREFYGRINFFFSEIIFSFENCVIGLRHIRFHDGCWWAARYAISHTHFTMRLCSLCKGVEVNVCGFMAVRKTATIRKRNFRKIQSIPIEIRDSKGKKQWGGSK